MEKLLIKQIESIFKSNNIIGLNYKFTLKENTMLISVAKENHELVFFYNKKNLERLNLIDSEIKALLCHELGHFLLGHLNLKNWMSNVNKESNYLILLFFSLGLTGFSYNTQYFFINILFTIYFIFLNLNFWKVIKEIETSADIKSCELNDTESMLSLLGKISYLHNFFYPINFFLLHNFNFLFKYPKYEERQQNIINNFN